MITPNMRTSSCTIIGGTNGIGAAFAKKLAKQYKKIYIIGRNKPIFTAPNIEHFQLDITKDSLEQLKNALSVSNTLIITAGIGRVDYFENLSNAEIEKTIAVNLTSTIKIIKLFYNKLLDNKKAYCLTMGSLAGELSSPLFSVYGATKAALNRFIESINIELEKQNSKNRILNVMPISFKGSSFNGEKTDLQTLSSLVDDCLQQMYSRKTTYIPQYDELCKNIIHNYQTDPHTFGLSSYDYKIKNNRINSKKKYIVGYLSGTFDLFHIGHLNLIRRAKEQCDYLIVGVHIDASHKGKETFIPFEERLAIVESLSYVDRAVRSEPEDSAAWDKYHYDKLFVGSDYKGTERFKRYEEYFKDKGVEIVFFPYTAGTSSTQLRDALSAISSMATHKNQK